MITLKKKFSDSYNFVFNKTVMMRVDLNVPITQDKITDSTSCLLYTSDAADDITRVDLGGRRIIKKKK